MPIFTSYDICHHIRTNKSSTMTTIFNAGISPAGSEWDEAIAIAQLPVLLIKGRDLARYPTPFRNSGTDRVIAYSAESIQPV